MKKNEANKLFENLFVLESANNHWGNLRRGKKIISEYGKVVRYNNVKAAMKLQFRDVPNFVHKDFKGREDLRYIWKTEKTNCLWCAIVKVFSIFSSLSFKRSLK